MKTYRDGLLHAAEERVPSPETLAKVVEYIRYDAEARCSCACQDDSCRACEATNLLAKLEGKP